MTELLESSDGTSRFRQFLQMIGDDDKPKPGPPDDVPKPGPPDDVPKPGPPPTDPH